MVPLSRSGALPSGWEWAELREIANPSRPRHKPKDYPELPFIGMQHVEAHTMRLLGTVPTESMKSSAVHFFADDVLYGRLRPYLNKVYRPDFEGLASAEFIVFPADRNLCSSYLQYFLNSSDFVEFAANLNTGDRPRVDFDQLSPFQIPLPPLAEQRRIVAAIEEQLTRLDAAVAGLERARANLKRYRASVLAAACSGRLVPTEAELARREGRDYETADQLLERILHERRQRWEADQLAKMQAKGKPPKSDAWKAKYKEPGELPGTNNQLTQPEGWRLATIDQLSVVVRGASPRPAGDPRYFGGSIPWITVGSLTANEDVYLRGVAETVTEAGREKSRFIGPGTLLLTNSGATLGVPKITLIGGCINDGSVALQGLPETVKLYLYYFLKTQTERLRRINQGAAQPNLNTTIVRQIEVPLPPLAEQVRIIAEIQRKLSVVDELERSIDHALTRAEKLRQSILRRAFEGKLVAQDPTDEPASVLLERIRAEREAEAAAKKQSRKRGSRKTKTKSQAQAALFELDDTKEGE